MNLRNFSTKCIVKFDASLSPWDAFQLALFFGGRCTQLSATLREINVIESNCLSISPHITPKITIKHVATTTKSLFWTLVPNWLEVGRYLWLLFKLWRCIGYSSLPNRRYGLISVTPDKFPELNKRYDVQSVLINVTVSNSIYHSNNIFFFRDIRHFQKNVRLMSR